MHTHDTVDSEPPASSLPDSWPTETGRITHARCFGRPRRGLLVTQRQIPEAWREGQLRSLLAGLPPSPLLRGQTSRSLAGGAGASTLPLRDGVTGVTGIVHEAWRAFSLHLTSCLCHPSATPSLLGARAIKHRWTLQRGRTSPHPSWFKGRKQNSHFCAAVGLLNWSK